MSYDSTRGNSIPVTSRAASLVGRSTYRAPYMGASSSNNVPPQRISNGLRDRASTRVRGLVTRPQTTPSLGASISAGYIPYGTPIGGSTYGQLIQGQSTLNANTPIGGSTYGQLTQGQATGAPAVAVAPDGQTIIPYDRNTVINAAIQNALVRSRVAPGTTPRYMGLANQLAGGTVVDSPEVRRTLNALLVEQGSAPIGGYEVQPGQIDSTTFYRQDGSYDWGAHNAARAAGLSVL